MRFEFHQYDESVRPLCVEVFYCRSDAAARSKAGQMAKRNNGPVDLARYPENGESWADRYMTTFEPSEYHASGYRSQSMA